MAYKPTDPEIEARVERLYAEWFPTRTVSLADSQWLRDILLPAARKQLIKEAEMQAAFAVEQVNSFQRPAFYDVTPVRPTPHSAWNASVHDTTRLRSTVPLTCLGRRYSGVADRGDEN